MAHIQDRGKDVERRWQARYRDPSGTERTKTFPRKIDAQRWIDEQKASMLTGRWIDPAARNMTIEEWGETWLAGYDRRPSTVKQARIHVRKIVEEFGSTPLGAVRPSRIRGWLSRLAEEGYADSYRAALHARLSQLMADAVHDRLIAENPCSRRTSPGVAETVQYLATTEHVWAMYHSWPERRRLAVLLGAYAGLRTAEVCGLRVSDVAFLEREIRPAVQYPSKPLKTPMSATPIPVPDVLLEAVAQQIERWPSEWVLTGRDGGQLGPWLVHREMRRTREQVDGLPEGFRFHDLRHFYASLLIASGADVKVVQARVRHASARTTLDVYGHLWPDNDETTRSAVARDISHRLTRTALDSRRLTESVRNDQEASP